MEEAKSNCSPEVSARAFGLYARFHDPTTLLGLNMAQIVLSPLESLNRSLWLQSPMMTIAGMLEAAKTVKKQLVDMRLDEKFTLLLSKVEQQLTAFSLGPLVVPRERKLPARFSVPAEAFHTKSVETHYRIEYFKLIDVAI